MRKYQLEQWKTDAHRSEFDFRKRSTEDEVLALALVRLLEVVGEAAKHVSQTTRKAHPELPWRAMAGTRDRLIHGYFDVDLDIVWAIIREDLPPLIAALEPA